MIQATVKIVAPAGKRTEILNVLECLRGPTEVSRGCHRCRILQDSDDLESLTYIVWWDTREQLEEHFRGERFRRLLPYLELSAEPPEVEIFDVQPIGGIDYLVSVMTSSFD